MGWFLTRKSTRKSGRKKSSKSNKSTASSWDPQKTLRTMRITGWVIGLAILIGGWFIGQNLLREELGKTRATMPHVVMVDAPQWMPDEVIENLRNTVAATVDPDPFNSQSLAEAAERLEASAWVTGITRLHRQPAGRIDVVADYRRPVALIQGAEGYHLVDARGIRLPLIYPEDRAWQLGLPMIQGVDQPPPHAGEPWGGGDVRAGLRLGMLIAAQPWSEQVHAVDVSNYGGRLDRGQPHLALVTDDGLVRWGRAPGEEKFFEPTIDVKLAHVELVLRKFGSIDAGGQVVDVFGDTVVTYPRAEAATLRYTSDQ